MRSDKVLPDFASEKEEAEWWDAHQDETGAHLAESISNGTALNLQAFLEEQGLLVEVESVTLPLLRDDLDIAKQQATSKGVRYEEYLSSLVHEALKSSRAA